MDRRQFIKLFNSVGLISLSNLPLPKDKKIKITYLPPNGGEWMLCDGRILYIEKYSELFDVIGTYYNKEFSAKSFYIPDFRPPSIREIIYGTNKVIERIIMPFIKAKGNDTPIGSIVHLSLGPDNVEIDPDMIEA